MALLLLRLRTWFGWGRHPDELRARSRWLLQSYVASILLVTAVLAVPLALEYFHAQGPLPVSLDPGLLTRLLVGGCGYVVVFTGGLLPPSITSWLLARRSSLAGMAHVSGRCFASIADPPGYWYARIGVSPKDAHWYTLPLMWDELLPDSSVEIELDVLASTRWVERMRWTGSTPRELIQPVPQFGAAAESARSAYSDERAEAQERPDGITETTGENKRGEASAEERRILRRFARRANLSWRASPRTILVNAWAFILSGVVFGPAMVALAIVGVLLSPQSFRDQGADVAGIILVVAFFVIDIVCIVAGVHMLRIWRLWRRLRPFRNEAPLRVVGEVESWVPYPNMWTPGASRFSSNPRLETLISLLLPDGQRRIFRIPYAHSYRVRRRGTKVEIDYVPTTERVTRVRRVEVPAEPDLASEAQQ